MSDGARRPWAVQRPWLGLVLSLGVALVYLATSLGTLAHFLVVEHVRCLEHGEWLHAADLPSAHSGTGQRHAAHRGSALVDVQAAAPATSEQRVVQPDGDEPPHKHEHCGQSGDARTHHDLGREVAVVRLWAARFLVAEAAAPRQLRLALPVYAYAPKTSPPGCLL